MIHVKKEISERALQEKTTLLKEKYSDSITHDYNNKCAYCEQKSSVDSLIKIADHRPLTHYPWLALEPSNWLPVCPSCNQYKDNHFPLQNEKQRVLEPQKNPLEWKANSSSFLAEGPLLLSPEIDFPEKYLSFSPKGKLYAIYSQGNRAQTTINLLKLNREELLSKRKKVIDDFQQNFSIAIQLFLDLEGDQNSKNFASLRKILIPIFEKLTLRALPSSEFTLLGQVMIQNFQSFFLQEKWGDQINDWLEAELYSFTQDQSQKNPLYAQLASLPLKGKTVVIKEFGESHTRGLDQEDVSFTEEMEEQMLETFQELLEQTQNCRGRLPAEVLDQLEFINIFLEDFSHSIQRKQLSKGPLQIQQFLKQWKNGGNLDLEDIDLEDIDLEDIDPEDITLEEFIKSKILHFSTQFTQSYNQKLASFCQQPQYTRLPDLQFSQSPYLYEEKEKALPLSLRQISIAGFQCLEQVHLFDLPTHSQWIMITGENGDGKTSLLQALAIALRGSEDAHPLFHQNTEIDLELQREGQAEFRYFSWEHSEIAQSKSALFSKKRQFQSQASSLEVKQWNQKGKETPQEREHIPYVLGYSPSRLSVETHLTKEERENPVYNLLRGKGNLEKLEDWLQKREREMESPDYSQEQKEIFRQQSENARLLITELMPNLEKIEIRGEKVLYYEKGKAIIWEHLSTGHQSVIAMIGDLLIRLFASQPEIHDPKKLKGIVLIDEIETHLHPKWEMKFPQLLSEAFPLIQFIATTHSPLPLLGIPKNSVVFTISRSPEKGSQIKRWSLDLANFSPNLVLTSPIFGLEHLLSIQNQGIERAYYQDEYSELKESQKLRQDLKELAPETEEVFAQYLEYRKKEGKP